MPSRLRTSRRGITGTFRGGRRLRTALAEVEAGSPHYLAPECYAVRAEIRIAQGDVEAAVADAEGAVSSPVGRRIPYETLSACADVLREAGQP